MHGTIEAIEYFLPRKSLSTADLSAMCPEWGVEKIAIKTGIWNRNLAGDQECASDLAVQAVEKLFNSGVCEAHQVDYLLLCTQSPDYLIPTTACLLQERLNIPVTTGALDFNLGCSGFVYGLGLAEGLISSGQAEFVLLITAETYTKYLSYADKGSRTIFGDGAAATLIKASDTNGPTIGPFVYGTDGRGACNLIVPNSGWRKSAPSTDSQLRGGKCDNQMQPLHMDGAKIFQFAIRTVPESVRRLLDKANLTLQEVDLYVFHQANAFLLNEIRIALGIPKEKVHITLNHCANTVSSTIPIALKHAELEGRLIKGTTVMLVGFGVGYSWGATIIRWKGGP